MTKQIMQPEIALRYAVRDLYQEWPAICIYYLGMGLERRARRNGDDPPAWSDLSFVFRWDRSYDCLDIVMSAYGGKNKHRDLTPDIGDEYGRRPFAYRLIGQGKSMYYSGDLLVAMAEDVEPSLVSLFGRKHVQIEGGTLPYVVAPKVGAWANHLRYCDGPTCWSRYAQEHNEKTAAQICTRIGDRYLCHDCMKRYSLAAPMPSVAGDTKTQTSERAKVTPGLRYDILQRDKFACKLCGRGATDGVILHVDHIVPIAGGGLTEPSNLQTLCQACNIGKGAKMPTNDDLAIMKAGE